MTPLETAPLPEAAPATPDSPALRVPDATYRLQFHEEFTFADAAELLPYLAELGISDVYASPIFRARKHSRHGYDICDHRHFNPELGGDEAFARFAEALRRHNLGLIFDIVPNHMGIHDPGNVWWMDVLENGPSSIYAGYFDISWHPSVPELTDRVLLPILEDQYGKVLEAGKFRLAFEDGAFTLWYGSIQLPVEPCSYGYVLDDRLDELAARLGETDPQVMELRSIRTAIRNLPPPTERDPLKTAERNREKEVIKRRLGQLAAGSPVVREHLATVLRDFNGDPADPHSFDRLDQVIESQRYRPAFWRVAAEEINYRRFFDVNDLAAIRVEVPEVFAAVHQLPLRLVVEGPGTGLRIDHPDGLWDPAGYFRQLQEAYRKARGVGTGDGNGRPEAADRPTLYVVAEKILGEGEKLPEDWAVAGTTGYDFLNEVNGLFIDRRHGRTFDRIYARFVGTPMRPAAIENSTKKMVMLTAMASEINALANELDHISSRSRRHRDFTLNSLRFALREVIACLPVYRTYIQGPDSVSERDAAYINRAVAQAKRQNPRTAQAIFDFLRDVLLLRNLSEFAPSERDNLIHFTRKFQQVTGPVTAKGVEDSAFYVYYRLASMNEVGGSLRKFGTTPAEFHRQNAERLRRWPHSMLATSTHDNKRAEAVRTRINVLSEVPAECHRTLIRLARVTAGFKTVVDGEPAPDRNDEYLFYQTVLGAWPAGTADPLPPAAMESFRERIEAYMLKACKEGQQHTSWINPNEEYEEAVRQFVRRCLDEVVLRPVVQPLLRRVTFYGPLNALSQTLLKLTAPGVPDTYQGTEMWDWSLVDPDNRRPVDYARRRAALAELSQRVAEAGDDLTGLTDDLLAHADDGRVKLYLMHRILTYRRERPALFRDGAYQELRSVGRKRAHAVAFRRQHQDAAVVVLAPRLYVRLTRGVEQMPLGAKVWGDTWLMLPRERVGRRYRNRFTGEVLTVQEGDGLIGLPVAEVCGRFPVALLVREEA